MTTIFDIFEGALREPRYIYLGVFIILMVGTRIVLPVTPVITPMSQDFYNVMAGAEAGDVVITGIGQPVFSPGSAEWPQKGTLQYLRSKGVCVIMNPGAGSQAFDLLLVKRLYDIPAEANIQDDPDYGKLFVLMPSGWFSDLYAVARSFRSTGDRDIFGNSFDDLPGISWIKDGKDIYSVIGGSAYNAAIVPFAQETTGTKVVNAGDGGSLTVQAGPYGVGQVKGVLIGFKGAFEMDYLVGYRDTLAFRLAAAEMLLSFFTIVLTLLYNIVEAYSRLTRKRPLSIVKSSTPLGG